MFKIIGSFTTREEAFNASALLPESDSWIVETVQYRSAFGTPYTRYELYLLNF